LSTTKFNIDNIRNPFEVGIYKQLKNLTSRKKISVGYEDHKIEYSITADYIPDFTLEFSDGRRIFIESKGWLRPEDKKKMKLVKQQYPDLDIRLLFQKNNRFPRSKTTYGMWADKLGYKWAVGEVPKEWIL